jgi:Endonuclease NucS C-terminal domain
MQIFEAAHKALLELRRPTHLRDLYEHIVKRGWFEFGAQDPIGALGVGIARHAEGIKITKAYEPKLFYRSAPSTYGLVEWLSSETRADLDLDESVSEAEAQADLDASLFIEKELHRWLYKNLEQNGLKALGYGSLHLHDSSRQSERWGRFNTRAVGEIDMLLVTDDGDYVVLELKRAASDETVGQICRYFGWVKENLAKGDAKVYGLILAQEISEQLRYAVKAANENIKCRLLTIEVTLGEAVR